VINLYYVVLHIHLDGQDVLCLEMLVWLVYSRGPGKGSIFLKRIKVKYVTGSAKTGHNCIFVEFLFIKYL